MSLYLQHNFPLFYRMLITECVKQLNKPWSSLYSELVVTSPHTCAMSLVRGCVHSLIPMQWWLHQERSHSRLHSQKKNKLKSSSFVEKNCLRCVCCSYNYCSVVFIITLLAAHHTVWEARWPYGSCTGLWIEQSGFRPWPGSF